MSLRPLVAGLAALAMIAVATPAQAGPSALQRDLDAIVAEGPASALAEVRDGGRIIRLTSGSARFGTHERVDPRGRFRVGSVTKMLIATVVMQLVAERQIGLDDKVDRWLPTMPGVTVRQLLDHTSGLYDVTRTLPLRPPSAFLPLRWKTWTPEELIARAMAEEATFPPGDGYAYTSTGYLILGMLIERVTGRPYAVEASRRLHLQKSTFPGTDVRIRGPHVRNYVPDGAGGVIDVTEMNPSVMGAAGEAVSTASDLNRFLTTLPPELLRRMKTVTPPSSRGLGLEFLDTRCGPAYGHMGDAYGTSAWVFATGPQHSVTLSVAWGTNRPSKASVAALIDDALCPAR
uniref:serine hydrolase domain-containing protein n=1 Tax=Paractinoplanes polyasparticus TaxID=2856853 RepID=UPI001C844392|nr:serine hydrolase domain-containing protein [Actinoplanes polyasparticus]